jgi:restriction system protein
MGYRRRTKEPYEKLNDTWDEYNNNIKRLKKYLELIEYDGINKNCNGSSEEVTRSPDYSIKEEGKGKIFYFPCEYTILNIHQLFEPIRPPEVPIPKEPPAQIVLDTKEYPEWYLKYFPDEVSRRNAMIDEMNSIKKELLDKRKFFSSIYREFDETYKSIQVGISSNDSNSNSRLIELGHLKHTLPKFLRNPFSVGIETDSRMAIVQFKFPDYQNENIIVGSKGTRGLHDVPKFATETAKKKMIKQTLYSLIIRAGYIAAKLNICNLFDSVVINVEQDWFDPATGQPRNGIIATLQAPVDYLLSLDLSKLDPEACFKYLKGISTPNLQNISPVRPIFTLNKNDERLVESKDVDSNIEPESNLAAMEWEDFEHLVAQLFEWEFSKNGIEVKVTRASRDRGVDAILFDPDPLKGGKYVIQAKRYTRTVDVSAVRDLYGTVMNEGANRGILITTASYGPDAYEFAKDKPISLVDGPNLLLMLQKHGKKFKIDLEEARRLNAINQNSN